MPPPQCYAAPKTGKVGFDINAETIDHCITGIIKRQAENLKQEVIDLHELTQNHEDWFDDGVHPNALGNQMIAEHLAVQLTK
jgi:lysophospholipase L1-like esterase